MADSLNICRSFLEQKYRELRGEANFCFSERFDDSRTCPCWFPVDTDSLAPLAVKIDASSNSGGLLLDPEIGVLLFILPFDESANIEAQLMCALRLRSELLPEANYAPESKDRCDPVGSWRIALHWLVSEDGRKKWLDALQKIKNETAFLEEIPVDAIVFSPDDPRESLLDHGFPRLLFGTRAALKRRSPDEVTTWLSADVLVEQDIAEFPQEFHKKRQRDIAAEAVQQMRSFMGPSTLAGKGKPDKAESRRRQLHSLRIQNCRNLVDLELDSGGEQVTATVIHGPNGTGKSNIVEALSLALFGSSSRYARFLRDHDISVRDRAAHYIDHYLKPLDKESSPRPEITINRERQKLNLVASPEDLLKSCRHMNGTVLAQETSTDFMNMSSDDLNTLVLRGYSEQANKLESYVEDKVTMVTRERLEFLQKWEAKGNITVIETAKARIARRICQVQLAQFPLPLVQWLEALPDIDNSILAEAKRLATAWKKWGDANDLEQLFEDIGKCSTTELIESALLARLKSLSTLQENTSAWFEKHARGNLSTPDNKNSTEFIDQVQAWWGWLEFGSKQHPMPADPKIQGLQQTLADLQKRQQGIVANGTDCKKRLEHFSLIECFVRDEWSVKKPHECPTCGTDLSSRNGVVSVIESLKVFTQAAKDRLTDEYKAIKEEIKQVQKQLAALGYMPCPISPQEESTLVSILSSLLSKTDDVRKFVAVAENREALIQWISALSSHPAIPSKVDAASEAHRVAGLIIKQFQEAERLWEEPDDWVAVRKALNLRLSRIVRDHLPQTLGQVWNEIALNLTPAPWLLPERPQFEVRNVRGNRGLTIKLEGKKGDSPLARYILNQAEIHVLGLAWFFTQYITHARFEFSFLILDDPAQEMDETTFRDLCRFLETLLRLHKICAIPLTLWALFHQEERALVITRCTRATLATLSWGGAQKVGPVRVIKLLGEGFQPRRPELRLFG